MPHVKRSSVAVPVQVALGFEEPFVVVPAPALWGPADELLLPDEVTLIALWQPYAGLVAAGVKGFETRGWPWPYEPRWLAIYASKTPDTKAFRRLGALADPHREPLGAVIVLVWIGGCRPMRPEDAERACYPFEAERFVWVIGAVYRLARPIALERGPQKFGHVTRGQLQAALDAPTRSTAS